MEVKRSRAWVRGMKVEVGMEVVTEVEEGRRQENPWDVEESQKS